MSFGADDAPDGAVDGLLPAWVSPWGAAALGVGTLALLSASLVGVWAMTVALAVLGLGAVGWGLAATRDQRKTRDRVWFPLAAVMNGGVLLLALFFSGLLNPLWPLDAAPPTSDPNLFEVVPRDNPLEGSPLADDDWANAATQAVRQHDAVVRLESVKAGPLRGRGGTYLLVHFRLANMGTEQPLAFAGFSNQNHQPVLKDQSGRTYAFVEQRPRLVARGPAAFGEPGEQALSLEANKRAESLLVFEMPSGGPWFLELPAAAWGRNGVCRLRIAGFFDASPSNKK